MPFFTLFLLLLINNFYVYVMIMNKQINVKRHFYMQSVLHKIQQNVIRNGPNIKPVKVM